MKIKNQTINGGNQQFADKIINQNRKITATNYVEGNVNGGNIAGGDINQSTNNRHQSIDGNATNSTINFGDNSILTNTLQQIPPENSELKTLLSQLQTLINNSTLADSHKKQALAEIQTIAEATSQPKEQQQNIIVKTLHTFKNLSAKLENTPETAIKLGETMTKISNLLAINTPSQNKAILLLKQSGFIGCGEAAPNLSTHYKHELATILEKKYDYH
jgi:hypothetical protein